VTAEGVWQCDWVCHSRVTAEGVWQCDWVCHSRVTAQAEWGAEEDVWALEGSVGDWRKLHNEEFHDLCCAQNFICGHQERWARHVACVGQK